MVIVYAENCEYDSLLRHRWVALKSVAIAEWCLDHYFPGKLQHSDMFAATFGRSLVLKDVYYYSLEDKVICTDM